MVKYPLSKTGQKRLATCIPDLQLVVNTLTNYQNLTVCCGARGRRAQNKAFREGTSQVQWPDSKHNVDIEAGELSMAVDIAPYAIQIANIDWEDLPAFSLMIGRALQIGDQLLAQGEITHKIVSGLDWDQDFRTVDHTFLDAPHLEARLL